MLASQKMCWSGWLLDSEQELPARNADTMHRLDVAVKPISHRCRWHMMCPVEIARDLSAFQAVRVGEDGRHVLLPEGGDGAGDESAGSDFAGHGEEDHVVASSADHRHQRPAHAALARRLTKSSAMTGCLIGPLEPTS